MKRVSLILPDDLYGFVVEEANKMGVSLSDVIRIVLRTHYRGEKSVEDGRSSE